MIRRLSFLVVVLFTAGCGGSNSPSPTSPTPIVSTPAPAPAPAPTPVTVTVAGVVTNTNTNAAVGGATVRIGSQSASTDGNGYYSIGSVPAGSATITATLANFNTATETFTVGAGDTRKDLRIVPFWTASGTGNTVFDMPSYVSRVRVTGRYTANSSNFVVKVAGRLLINELLGTGWPTTTYDGTHLTSGGVVEITISSGVAWAFAQVQ